MALYTVGASFSGINTAGRAYAVLNAGATRRLRVYRISIAIPVAPTTVPQLQLLRQTVAGVTPGATTTPQALDPTDAAAGASLYTGGFGTQPTLTTASPLDVGSMPVTAGAGWVWNFSTPIEVAAGTANGLAIYNAAASGATTGTWLASFLYDE